MCIRDRNIIVKIIFTIGFVPLLYYIYIVNNSNSSKIYEDCFIMEARGRMGNLMFEYAAVHGLCIKRGLDPAKCASMIITEKESVYAPFEEFTSIFNIRIPQCKSNNKIFIEHLGNEGGIGYDHSIMSQEVGTTLRGYFQSHEYILSLIHI